LTGGGRIGALHSPPEPRGDRPACRDAPDRERSAHENNPRHNDEAVDAVATSLEAFDFRQLIVVDEQGVIIVGHTRYKAALKLRLTEVPFLWEDPSDKLIDERRLELPRLPEDTGADARVSGADTRRKLP